MPKTTITFVLFVIPFLGAFIFLFICMIRALLKYIRSKDVRDAKQAARVSLGEAIKSHRMRCRMTQEFVAEALGVSRQSVSKWEKGAADPSTGNLIALARLFKILPEELLSGVS